MHARSYNPLLGRFTSVDRGAPIASMPQSWNRYAYGLNRPTVFRDATGRSSGVNYDEVTQKIGPLSGLVWLYTDSPMAKAEKIVLGSVAAAAALTGGLVVDTVLTVTGVRFMGDVERDLQTRAARDSAAWGEFDSSSRALPVTASALSWIPKYADFVGLDIRGDSSHSLSKDIAKALEPEQWEVTFIRVEDEITVTTTFEELPLLTIPQRTYQYLQPLPPIK